MKKEIVIIGSGISSLTAAILFLQEGHKVTILEQHYVPGGYLHCFNRFGHRFETGGHYFGALKKGKPFEALLSYLGVFEEEDFIELNQNAVDHYHFHNFEFQYGVGFQHNSEKLSALYPEQKTGIFNYFQLVEQAADTFPTYNFKTEYNQKEMLSHLDKSLTDVFDELNLTGNVREILSAPCVLHGVSPQDVRFGVHAIMIDSLMQSAHGFTEGGTKLAKRFTDKIKSLGGELHLRKKVFRVETQEKMVTALLCEDGSRYTGTDFLSGIHPKLLFEMIGHEKLKPAFRTRLNKVIESAPFIGAYAVLDESAAKLFAAKTNYYFYPQGIPESFKAKDIRSSQPLLFISSAKRRHDGTGDFPIAIHASCPEDFFEKWSKNYKKEGKSAYEQAKRELFQSYFPIIEQKYPGFKAAIKSICYSSPLTNIFYNPSPNGSAYGIYHDHSCTGARSLGPASHFRNLTLTGQNTLFPGMLGASISGLRSAGNIVGIKHILRDLEERIK